MLFSAFAGFGAFAFSSNATRGEKIYRAMVATKIDAFDMTPGTYQEAKTYAQAMGLARARYTLERALNQINPLRAIELLNQLEIDWAVIPGEFDTIVDRQVNLAARMILSRGARREAVETGLRAILGSSFVAYRVTDPSEALVREPPANFIRTDLPFKFIQITAPITGLTIFGLPTEVTYEHADKTAGPVVLQKGDVLSVEPNNTGLKEVVTVLAVTSTTFTAVFTKPHGLGAYATTQNWPDWISTQRSVFVVVDAVGSNNVKLIRRVNEFMGVISRGVTLWNIVTP